MDVSLDTSSHSVENLFTKNEGAAAGPDLGLRGQDGLVYVVYSNRDCDFGDGRRAREASVELLGQLRAAQVKVVEQVADYSPGWAGWRGRDDGILATLFALPKATP